MQVHTNMDGYWSQIDLRNAFELLIGEHLWPTKFVFFIDGVDEYMSDPSEPALVLKTLAISGDVKLVISSRPWTNIGMYIEPMPSQSLA